MRLGKYLSSLNKPEVDERVNICGFTKEEEKIIYLSFDGKSRVEIAQTVQISARTLDRRISHIKDKILKYGNNIDGGGANERSSDL